MAKPEPPSYYVTADWSRFVPEGDAEARFGVAPVDVDRLGLREALDAFLAPAPPPPEPATKQAERPADKAMKRPADK